MNSVTRHLTALFFTISLILIHSHVNASTISVLTTDDFGTPLTGVRISIFNMDHLNGPIDIQHPYRVGLSDSGGVVWFYHLFPGTYRLQAEYPSFTSAKSDIIRLENSAVIFCTIRITPFLSGLSESIKPEVTIRYRNFPFVSPFPENIHRDRSIGLIPEIMESIPGVTIQPESGLPVYPAQRTSDVGLYMDDISLQDPYNQRPAFFPPAALIELINDVRAGQDTNQQSVAGGAVYLQSRRPPQNALSGFVGITDIVYSNSFLQDEAAMEMFDHWNTTRDYSISAPETLPDLSDQRIHLLLQSSFSNFSISGAADWRHSNRGYAADYVNTDSLKDMNTWLRSTYMSDDGNLSLLFLLGYNETSSFEFNQWKLRGSSAILNEHEKFFTAFRIGQILLSSYWYDFTLSSLYLKSVSGGNREQSVENNPYDSSSWSSDHRRTAHRLVFRGGSTTEFHAVETGISLSFMDASVDEGFMDSEYSDYAGLPAHTWSSDVTEYEFSVWGRDRWFLSDNLEVGFGMRWDRFDYLDQADYLSPRVHFAWNWSRNRIVTGMERIIQSPGIGFLSTYDYEEYHSDMINPITEPQSGFRWFAGYQRQRSKYVSFSLNGYYSFLSQMIFMFPIETEPGVLVHIPSMGDSGKSMGFYFDSVWTLPGNTAVFKAGYGFNRTRISWGDDVSFAHIKPDAEMPWRNLYFSDHFHEPVPINNDQTHTFRLYGETVIPVLGLELTAEYRYSSGFRWTPRDNYQQTADTIPVTSINVMQGPSVQRLDIGIQRFFCAGSGIRIKTEMMLKNALNTYQFTITDPVTGQSALDPYRFNINQPRTLWGGIYIFF